MKLRRMCFALVGILCLAIMALAQTPMVATSVEQEKIRPLVSAETKAREAVLAKSASLPESKAVADAKVAYDKAVADLDKAAKALPEHSEWIKANAAVVGAAYQIMADHKLSSLDYWPKLSEKGELVFTKKPPAQ